MKCRQEQKKYFKNRMLSMKYTDAENKFTGSSFIKNFNFSLKVFSFLTCVYFILAQAAFAASVTLTWNRNQEPDIAGYKIYYGTSSHNYTESTTINDTATSPLQISHTVSGLGEGMTYYFAVKAFDLADHYSDYSQEVSVTIPGTDSGSEGNDGGQDDGDGQDSQIEPLDFKVNFQPANAQIPAGFAADAGQSYSASRGYGWVGSLPQVVDSNSYRSADQQHDTLALARQGMTWEMAVPPGSYDVTVCIGSPVSTYLFQSITVEGQKFFSNVSTFAGKWSEKTGKVYVSDGRLTLNFGSLSRSYVALNFIAVTGEGTVVPADDQNQAPRAVFSPSTLSGQVPLEVSFNASGSFDPDGSIVAYSWNFGDGSSSSGAVTSHVFTSAGTYNVKLTVKDDDGATATKTVSISVANSNNNSGGSGDQGASDEDEGTESGPVEFKVNFQPANARIPAGFAADAGQSYSASRGYGWVGSLPQVVDRNSYRSADQQHDTFALARQGMTWEMAVPAGTYEVTVCIGSPVNMYLFQGVKVEGIDMFNRITTRAGQWLEKTTSVYVSDGKLTLKFSNLFNSYVAADYVIVKEK